MHDMLGRKDVVSVLMARDIMFENFIPPILSEVKINISDSYKRVLSRKIFSPENLPEFARSTVDGFAVKSSDTFGATEGMPAYLNIIGEIFMGQEASVSINKGEAVRIATGGMLPLGSDAVVMIEDAQETVGNMIEVMKPYAPGENVIQAGEDIKNGEMIFDKGHRIRPQDAGALAGLGITDIYVYAKPKVAIISTGDEIIPADKKVKAGQVRDINSYNLAGLISEAGGEPVKYGIFKDEYNLIKETVIKALDESSMVLITGGSSVGTKDLTAKIINEIGTPGVLFHGVSIKPGKPTIGGFVKGKPVFGLPGHPAAITICFEQFVEPILVRLTGMKENSPYSRKPVVNARMAKNVASSSGREDHVRVAIEDRNGELWAVPILGKSGLITTLVKADGIVVIPLSKLGLEQGEIVEVKLFH